MELKAKLNGWTALMSDFGLALEISEEEARNENIKRSSMAGTWNVGSILSLKDSLYH